MCVWKSSQTDASVTQKWSEYAASGRLVRTSQRGVYEGLLNGDCEIAITEVSTWDVFQYDENINGDCALGWIGRPFLTIPASFGVKGDSGSRCTSLLRDVFNLYIHDMEVDGTLTNLWDEHIAFSATVNCGIDPETDDDDAFLRRMVDSKQRDSRKKGNNANENANNQIPRHLKATAAKNAASAGDEDPETIKLTLTNMGGVFMLHGILSTLSLLCALVPWAWRAYSKQPKKGKARREKLSTVSCEAHRHDTHHESDEVRSEGGASAGSQYYFDAMSKPSGEAIDELRVEMAQKLGSIEEKLAALLLDKKKQ